MLDIQFIRQHPDKIKKACEDKGLDKKVVDIDHLLKLDEERKKLTISVQNIRQQRNILVSNVKGRPSQNKINEGKKLKTQLNQKEEELTKVEQKLNYLLKFVPNIPAEDVPVGKTAEIIRKWGNIPKFNFPIKDHIQLAKNLSLIDFERGSKVAGFRGYFLKNEAVLIHLALINWALQKMIAKGFKPFATPTVVKKECFYYTGHFPWGEKEAYHLESEKDFYLTGTAEVPMVAYHSNEVLLEKDLPLQYVAFSPCFRREIGSYGKDTKGIYRLHEFLKIEQIVICKNDWQESATWLEDLAKNSEELLRELNLPYRVCLMPTQDMGEPQIKKYDIEAWMPGRNEYGEVMSDSMMGEFQARRANIKYQSASGEKLYVHTLNNTAIASPRILIAILENNQQKDGSVKIPKVLQKYIGKDIIKPKCG